MLGERTADDVLELVRGYQSPCVLAAAADLDLFSVLNDAGMGAAEIADKLGADLRATTILLDALAALGFVEKRQEQYVLLPATARLLSRKSPAGILPLVQHHANCLRRWTQLASVVQTGKPVERQPGVRGEQRAEEAFIDAMHVVSTPVASKLIAQLGPPAFSHLLDVGGASGTWTIAFLRTRPDATATLFDLPHVIPMAKRRISEAEMSDRVRLVAGDFYTDALPSGADLAWLGAIVHQNSREQNRRLFTAIASALVDGGSLLIRDMLMDESRTNPVAGALFAVNMLVATEGGGTFTYNELREDLERAGFTDVNVLHRDEGMNSVIRAARARDGAGA